MSSFAQTPNQKILFVIDSIPLLNDPEEWNPILQDDISDITVLKNKDTLKILGWEHVDGITYIFTKEYRNRPDSIKRIPSLKQMEMKNSAWNLHESPYSGNYIDYYNSGRIQNRGTLLNGKLNGELIVYFKNGTKKSVSNYKDGTLHGIWNEYYINGVLMQSREYVDGKYATGKIYFLNGQIGHELKTKSETPYDTAFTYYSSGKVKQMRLIRNGVLVPDKEIDEINYYNTMFYNYINKGNLREANKSYFKIWRLDSTSADTYFKEGLLMMKEFRFNEAIADFDKALTVEPLMREAVVHRALARIKRQKFANGKKLSKGSNEPMVTVDDLILLPNDEQQKVCKDLQQAKYLDFSEYYIMKIVPLAIINFCQQAIGNKQ